MSKYSKLIAAVIGVVAIVIGPEILGLADEAKSEMIAQSVLALLTAFGVYQVPNKT